MTVSPSVALAGLGQTSLMIMFFVSVGVGILALAAVLIYTLLSQSS